MSSVTATFETDEDFKLGMDPSRSSGNPQWIIYSSPMGVTVAPHTVFTYGGYDRLAMTQALGLSSLWTVHNISPVTYNVATTLPSVAGNFTITVPPPPSIANGGTRCALLSCFRPDPTYNDDARRNFVHRGHANSIKEKTVEAWLWFPSNTTFNDWNIMLYLHRELLGPYYGNVWLTNAIGTGNSYSRGSGRYGLTTAINHCTMLGTKWDCPNTAYGAPMNGTQEYFTLGEWFYIKGHVIRDYTKGRIQWWLLTQAMINSGITTPKLIIDIIGGQSGSTWTPSHPSAPTSVCTDFVSTYTPEVDTLPFYNTGNGRYVNIATGMANYQGDQVGAPTFMAVKNWKTTYGAVSSNPTLTVNSTPQGVPFTVRKVS